jgi:hypothetical protein
MTGVIEGWVCVLQRQGGFETRPYKVIVSLPFNTKMLNHLATF